MSWHMDQVKLLQKAHENAEKEKALRQTGYDVDTLISTVNEKAIAYTYNRSIEERQILKLGALGVAYDKLISDSQSGLVLADPKKLADDTTLAMFQVLVEAEARHITNERFAQSSGGCGCLPIILIVAIAFLIVAAIRSFDSRPPKNTEDFYTNPRFEREGGFEYMIVLPNGDRSGIYEARSDVMHWYKRRKSPKGAYLLKRGNLDDKWMVREDL